MNLFIKVAILYASIFGANSLYSQPDTLKSYIFGNSTIDHRPPLIPTPSDETTVPHWMFHLAEIQDTNYAATGQFGTLPSHAASLPPSSNWGYNEVPAPWLSGTFADTDFDNVMITPLNYVQYRKAHENYEGPDSMTSPLLSALEIFDWAEMEEPNIRLYLYENWPDMAPYLSNFPPTPTEFENYNNYTQGGYHDWFIEYHDSLVDQRMADSIKLIPVGNIVSELLSDTLLDDIPILELYEDDAPHGRASVYFLAGLVCYMSIYENIAPMDFTVPNTVHIDIQNNYPEIVSRIWQNLIEFEDTAGKSRVFFDENLMEKTDIRLLQDTICAFPNPQELFFQIKGMTNDYDIDILDSNNQVIQNLNSDIDLVISINDLPMGQLFIRIRNKLNPDILLQKIIKDQ